MLNLNISNVPGPRQRARWGRDRHRDLFGRTADGGQRLNITVWSYVDQLNISVLTDTATVDDPHEVTDAMVRIPRDTACSRDFR